MRSSNKSVITLPLVLWLLISISADEEQGRMESRIIIGDILYLYWKVNAFMENSSDVITFHINYCPVEYEFENCKVNITICEANYTGSPLYGATSTHQDTFSAYLANGASNLEDKVIRDDTPALLSSSWNISSRQFMCAIHNVKECKGGFGEKLGDFMITTSVNHTQLLEITSYEVNPRLKQPGSINISQKNSDVIINWRSSYKCNNDIPDVYRISLKNNENGHERKGKDLHTFGQSTKVYWEYTFTSLDPHTTYTVYIYAFVIFGEIAGPVVRKDFRTAEAAPSMPPSIKCSLCARSTFFHPYRNVTVGWRLPPRNTLNGIIRLAILVYWEKGHPNETSTVKVHNNSTVAILPYLKQNGKYSFRVKVCTLANQCSANSKEGSIEEEVTNMLSRGASKSHDLKPWVTALYVSLPLVLIIFVVVASLAFWFFFYWSPRRRERMNNPLEDLREDPNYLTNHDNEKLSNLYDSIVCVTDEGNIQEENKSNKEESVQENVVQDTQLSCQDAEIQREPAGTSCNDCN